ncbi:MAG: hypothetical protein HUN05_09865 [Desulfobacter sp.]|nr:MAG: hypothetical protein HUN05_09865 [Desulfobacter sp.]
MDVTSIQGPNPYANNRPAAEDSLVQQNREALKTDLNPQNVQAANQAFQVNITQEARNQQAQETQPMPETPDQPPAQQRVSQIIDTVA